MKDYLKKLWQGFVCLAEDFGRARAASELARQGHYKLAREMMTGKNECC